MILFKNNKKACFFINRDRSLYPTSVMADYIQHSFRKEFSFKIFCVMGKKGFLCRCSAKLILHIRIMYMFFLVINYETIIYYSYI